MDEMPLPQNEARPNAGGSYVRLPDGSLMPEADWLAAQAAGAAMVAAPIPEAEPPESPPPARGRARKEG